VAGALYQYLFYDHERLDKLLAQAISRPDAIDMDSYAEFRKGLLRHIAMEEKVVLPAIAQMQGGKPSPIADRLRLDHGALVALLVPPPTTSIVFTLCSILQVHNELEEKDGGLYQTIEQLTGPDVEKLLTQLKNIPDVPVLPYNERPNILESTRRAVERAGYKFNEV
jgi:hypothetical protein